MLMFKKILVLMVMLTVVMLLVVPIHADPADIVLDQQVTLAVPASLELVDADRDGRVEAVRVKVKINNYREGNFTVTGKLETMLEEGWTEIDRIQTVFQWSPDHDVVELSFSPGLLRKEKLSGPYRASISLKEGEWELPMQVVGVSPQSS